MQKDWQRLGVPNQRWRISTANRDFRVCPSYPSGASFGFHLSLLLLSAVLHNSQQQQQQLSHSFYRTRRACLYHGCAARARGRVSRGRPLWSRLTDPSFWSCVGTLLAAKGHALACTLSIEVNVSSPLSYPSLSHIRYYFCSLFLSCYCSTKRQRDQGTQVPRRHCLIAGHDRREALSVRATQAMFLLFNKTCLSLPLYVILHKTHCKLRMLDVRPRVRSVNTTDLGMVCCNSYFWCTKR